MPARTVFTAILIICAIGAGAEDRPAPSRPNIVLILADDMGWSDIGCYGGEIPTPHLDALAEGGLRFSQFYNSARCSPTRASLLTGLYPHQTGMGGLAESSLKDQAASDAADGYLRYLNRRCVTLAEVLAPAGYRRYMAGKWHLGMNERDRWPLQRGFERFYGILGGTTSYFRPAGSFGLYLDNDALPPPAESAYYTTDAFTDRAIQFLHEQKSNDPFFLYLAFNAPHWPLHARPEDIERFRGRYRQGWSVIRNERLARQVKMGLLNEKTVLSPQDDGARDWSQLSPHQQDQLDERMAVYAAQIFRLDWNVGRLVTALKEMGCLETTLILFLSDNGGCAEPYTDLGGGRQAEINDPAKAGAVSYGTGWANASNTPFRKYKATLYEGGIRSPLIVHWPHGLRTPPGSVTDSPASVLDVMPTLVEVAGATYPGTGAPDAPLRQAGTSILPILKGDARDGPEWFFWEQYQNRAIRHGRWKAVRPAQSASWELYDLDTDPVEQSDIASGNPQRVADMAARWDAWAAAHLVLPKRKPGTTPAKAQPTK